MYSMFFNQKSITINNTKWRLTIHKQQHFGLLGQGSGHTDPTKKNIAKIGKIRWYHLKAESQLFNGTPISIRWYQLASFQSMFWFHTISLFLSNINLSFFLPTFRKIYYKRFDFSPFLFSRETYIFLVVFVFGRNLSFF